MKADYRVRPMHPDEVQIAIDWADKEGWNPGLHDAQSFYLADPNGFFLGEKDGKVISVGSAVVYDDQFAFCGLYIVHPDYRGQGYGIGLTQERLRYLNPRNAGIDGVVENISIYERIGYRLAYHNIRYQGVAAAAPNIKQASLVPLTQLPFANIEAYDRQCFPARRSRFLQNWINQSDGLALGYVKDGLLLGFGVRRQCIQGHKIGPLFTDNYQVAEALFIALQQDIIDATIFLDITSINAAATRLVQNHHMQEVFSTGRMYLKGQPELADEKIFGITTFELG